MCNNYYNVNTTDGDSKAFEDGDHFAGDDKDSDLASATTDEKPQDWQDFLCIFGDCFVKYVHIVLIQAWWETSSAEDW